MKKRPPPFTFSKGGGRFFQVQEILNLMTLFLAQFLFSAFTEADPEVCDELRAYLSAGDIFRNEMMVLHTDAEKFKNGVRPELVMQLLTDCALGLFSVRTADDCSPEIIDRRMDRFRLYLALLKQNFYKEAYL
ncbi:MAG: hypothetical protein HFF48_03385 [Lawsonibacter sp.]|jgi:hypothetical protein|nr:hypothetical protein [Lawsonibacter sp.]